MSDFVSIEQYRNPDFGKGFNNVRYNRESGLKFIEDHVGDLPEFVAVKPLLTRGDWRPIWIGIRVYGTDLQYGVSLTRSVRITKEETINLKAYEQAVRQKWRALALVIKAKLEAVESGISVFEQEFLANIILSDGRTVSQHVLPRIAEDYESGNLPPLLPAAS